MKRGRLPDWCSEYERGGRLVVRFRRTGFKTYYFKSRPWTSEFMAEYQACLDGSEAPRVAPGAKRTKPGSIDSLCVAYYRSPEFLGLADSSKKTTRGIVDRFREEHGGKSVAQLKRHHIKAIIGKKQATPSAANNLLIRIRILLNFAVDASMIPFNPALGLKGFRVKSDGFHTWTEDEIAQFETVHPIGSRARLAMTLMLYTGAARADVVRLGRQHMAGGRVRYARQKTGKEVDFPIHPELARVIAETPTTNLTYLMTAFGRPFSVAGFGNWMREVCDEAGLPECSSHGLKKAISRRLAEAGCSHAQIKSITAHVTDKEVSRYTAAASRSTLADQAMGAIGGTKAEQKLATDPEAVAKREAK